MARKDQTPPAAEPELTHLIGRSKRDRFRRAGVEFTKAWTAFPIASLTREQVNAILAQDDEIDARLVTEDDAKRMMGGLINDEGPAGGPSRAELVQALDAAGQRIASLEARCVELQLKLAGDRPPLTGQPNPGEGPSLPTPGIAPVAPPLPIIRG